MVKTLEITFAIFVKARLLVKGILTRRVQFFRILTYRGNMYQKQIVLGFDLQSKIRTLYTQQHHILIKGCYHWINVKKTAETEADFHCCCKLRRTAWGQKIYTKGSFMIYLLLFQAVK